MVTNCKICAVHKNSQKISKILPFCFIKVAQRAKAAADPGLRASTQKGPSLIPPWTVGASLVGLQPGLRLKLEIKKVQKQLKVGVFIEYSVWIKFSYTGHFQVSARGQHL